MLGYGENKHRTSEDHALLTEHLEMDDVQREAFIESFRDELTRRNLLQVYQDPRAFALLRYGTDTARSLANRAAHYTDREQVIAALDRMVNRHPGLYDGHAVLIRSQFPKALAETVAEGGAVGGGEVVAEEEDYASEQGSEEAEGEGEGNGNDAMHGFEATN